MILGWLGEAPEALSYFACRRLDCVSGGTPETQETVTSPFSFQRSIVIGKEYVTLLFTPVTFSSFGIKIHKDAVDGNCDESLHVAVPVLWSISRELFTVTNCGNDCLSV